MGYRVDRPRAHAPRHTRPSETIEASSRISTAPNLPLWYSVRRQARIEDVRLHDLRDQFASHAVLQGIPLPVVSRLLGHKRPSMTLRYAHVSDRQTEAAAKRIGATIAQALEG